MIWDSAKDEIIAEYSFTPKFLGREPGRDPKVSRIPCPFSVSQPSWPPKSLTSESGKDEQATRGLGNLSAWISPTIKVPVLALLWVYDAKFKLSIVNYSSGAMLYDYPPQPWYLPSGLAPVVSASFSEDGSTFVFLQQDLLFVHSFTTGADTGVRVATTYLPMGDIYDELVPTFENGFRLQLNFDGSLFMLISPSTLSALVLYARKDDIKVHEEHRSRVFYKRQLREDRVTGPLPVKDEQDSIWLAGSDNDSRISLLFPRSVTTVCIWNHDLHPFGNPNDTARVCTGLVMNDDRTRTAWECDWFIGNELQVALIVADLTLLSARGDGTKDAQDLPTLKVILHQRVHSRCNSLLLNKSGDRLIRRTEHDCELLELPSGTRLATWNLWDIWVKHSGQKKKRNAGLLPLIQHPTDPNWLLCVNVFVPKAVAMLSWRDFTLSLGKVDEEPQVLPCSGSAGPQTEPLLIREPTRPDRLPALVHGLETLVPEISSASNYGAGLWKDCFRQYTLFCAAQDPCFKTVDKFFEDRGFLPIAFFGSSRTLVFVESDMWIYSTQVGAHIPTATNGGASPSMPSRPPRPSGPGAFSPSCPACGLSHPIRARRHMYAGFSQRARWKCVWKSGGTAPDGRRKMDFSFWGVEPTDRIIVRDGLRYADEVEWVEYRNEMGQVWKSEWRLVERMSMDRQSKAVRVV